MIIKISSSKFVKKGVLSLNDLRMLRVDTLIATLYTKMLCYARNDQFPGHCEEQKLRI